MITADTRITDRHRNKREAEILASEIMRDAHPKAGLVTFLALGQHQLLTAIILHTAHTRPNTPLKAIADRVGESSLSALGSNISNSSCNEASAIWNETLGARRKDAKNALVFNIAIQLVAMKQRAEGCEITA